MSFARPRHRVKVAPKGATLTEQHWKVKQDIKNMVRRYLAGDTTVVRKCTFADVSSLPDNLHDFLDRQFDAVASFDALDDAVKAKFATPSDLLRALHDDANHAFLREVGILAPERKEPSAVKVEVVNPLPVTPSGANLT